MNVMHVTMQLVCYELFDILPCSVLGATPFCTTPHSHARMLGAVAALYVFGIFRRLLAFFVPGSASLLSLLWIVLYIGFFRLVYHTTLSKILFVLITVLNFATLISIFYNFLGNILFANQLHAAPYGAHACICLAASWLLFFPLQYWLTTKLAPLISSQFNEKVWRFLWLMPATFCVFFYYNLYTDHSGLSFFSSNRNFIFALVISGGFFSVLLLMVRLVQENNQVLQLKAENYQLSLQSLQYQSLQDRMEETRRARHDLRQSMAVINAYLQHGNRDELEHFASSYCAALPVDKPILYCRNSAINAVLSYYEERAHIEHISFSAAVEYPETTAIPDTEIVVLLGNLLENAIDACIQQQSGAPLIDLSLRMQGQSLVAVLRNTYTGTRLPDNGAFPSSKHAGEGTGLASVRHIAEKHNGAARFTGDGHIFCASVTLF